MELRNKLSLVEKGIEENKNLKAKFKLYSDLAIGNEKKKTIFENIKKSHEQLQTILDNKPKVK